MFFTFSGMLHFFDFVFTTNHHLKIDFYTHVGNIYWSSMMTITGAHVMKYNGQVSIVLALVPHMRVARM